MESAPVQRRAAAGADHRRDRHRQGARRARAALRGPAPCRPVRRDQLRDAVAATHRVRTVRPRARRLHRRQGAAHRADPVGRPRHAVPRRDRRDAAGVAGQAAQGAGGPAGAPGRQRARPRGRCPLRRGDQRAARGTGAQRRVPRGPAVPAADDHARRAAAARARRGCRAAGRAFPGRPPPPLRAPDLRLEACALEAIRRHSWPGNVRELRNVLEQAALLSIGVADHARTTSACASRRRCATRDGGIGSGRGDAGGCGARPDRAGPAAGRRQRDVGRAGAGITRDTLRYRMDKHQLRRNAFT